MPVYEFKCKECHASTEKLSTTSVERCDRCSGPLKRVFTCNLPSPRTGFKPHYNYTVGAYVSSWSDYCDKLQLRSEHNSEVTGIEHSYTPIEARDMTDLPGVTAEGLDTPRYDPNLLNKKVFT
jgi:putative FmdB family regulatory protein